LHVEERLRVENGEMSNISDKMTIVDPSKIFNPETQNIKKIFRGTDSFYQIPDYQRPYSWGDEEIETLFDDIYSAMQEKIEGYFLGPSVLVKHDDYLEVVDGQQRLTTLTILFCVVRDIYGRQIEAHDKILYNSISDSILSTIENKSRLKLITQINMQVKFEHEILEKVEFPEKEFSEKDKEKLENKFANSAFVLREKLKFIENQNGFEGIINFLQYLMERVEIITITCPDISYAIKLFQVINTRGLDLTAADLIKSGLLGKFGPKEEIERKAFISVWTKIEELSKEMEEPMTDLLTYYEYYLLAENPKRDLYTELSKKFRSEKPSDTAYNFSIFVKNYYDLYKLETSLLFSFGYLQNQVFWKAILTTAKCKNVIYFDDLAKELRKMYYLYWIAGYTSTKIKQTSFNIIGWIKADHTFEQIKNKIEDKMIEDDVYLKIKADLEADAYGEQWLKPLLVLVEYAQTDQSKISFIDLDKNLHIDHILPEKWKQVKEWKDTWLEEDANRQLDKIGNLTLLMGKKNIVAQNFAFVKKQKIYQAAYGGKTAFEISKRILEKSEWTTSDVDERREWLIAQINELFEIAPISYTLTAPSPILPEGTYTEEDKFKDIPENIIKIYKKIKEDLIKIDSAIEVNPRQYYISLRTNKNFAFITLGRRKLDIVIMLPYEKGESLIKRHKIKRLGEGHQGFYKGPCFEVEVDDEDGLIEIVNAIKEAKELIENN
jgi:uncharacterized protein with ParB-like and HNH nuclease domain/predicted transport protein